MNSAPLLRQLKTSSEQPCADAPRALARKKRALGQIGRPVVIRQRLVPSPLLVFIRNAPVHPPTTLSAWTRTLSVPCPCNLISVPSIITCRTTLQEKRAGYRITSYVMELRLTELARTSLERCVVLHYQRMLVAPLM